MINALELKDVLELPDYFKIMKKFPLKEIKKIIKKYSKKEFSKCTGICIGTIASWFNDTSIKNISTGTYKKIVSFFDKYNIDY